MEAALHSIKAYAMSKGIRGQLEILDETDALKGALIEKLDEIESELKELSLFKEESGGCGELHDITRELQRTAHKLVQRFDKDNTDIVLTTTAKPSGVRCAIRELPHMDLPIFEGDPLEWRRFW